MSLVVVPTAVGAEAVLRMSQLSSSAATAVPSASGARWARRASSPPVVLVATGSSRPTRPPAYRVWRTCRIRRACGQDDPRRACRACRARPARPARPVRPAHRARRARVRRACRVWREDAHPARGHARRARCPSRTRRARVCPSTLPARVAHASARPARPLTWSSCEPADMPVAHTVLWTGPSGAAGLQLSS